MADSLGLLAGLAMNREKPTIALCAELGVRPRDLADSVTLHDAYTFQKAQEQAVTDGLAGVKAHRFFAEAI